VIKSREHPALGRSQQICLDDVVKVQSLPDSGLFLEFENSEEQMRL